MYHKELRVSVNNNLYGIVTTQTVADRMSTFLNVLTNLYLLK